MKVKCKIVIMSHLSDVQEMIQFTVHNSPDVQIRLNFVKHLLLKFPDTDTEIYPDVEWENFRDSI